MQFLDTIKNNLLNIVFPAKCIVCGMSEFDLCINCLSKCPVAERESAKWIFPLYDYRDPNIKKALWLLKYKGKKRLANTFALALYDRILEELSDLSVMENFNDAILIPIPLSDKRHRERGYNQAELICKELIKIENLRYVENEKLNSKKNFSLENNILIKPKETIHQAHIENRAERLKNIIGSFAIKSDGQGREENLNKIKNRNIIIIDDITTTGATLSEAKKVLKQAGAKKIVAFTLAH